MLNSKNIEEEETQRGTEDGMTNWLVDGANLRLNETKDAE